MPGPNDEQNEDELQPTRPTFSARMRNLIWPPGSPEAQTAINDASGLNAAASVRREPRPSADMSQRPDEAAPVEGPIATEPQPVPGPDSAASDGYLSYADAQAAKEPPQPAYDLRADNQQLVEMRAGERSPREPVEQAAQPDAGFVPAPSASQMQPQVDPTLAADARREHVRTGQTNAARKVTEDRRAPEPPANPTEPAPLKPQEHATADMTAGDAHDLSTRDGQAPSSARFEALKPDASSERTAELDAWAAAQIPAVARQHFEMWREANEAAVHAVEHMHANVPDHSQDVETRLTGLTTEVRHGFHQARTGLDLIENPTPATLSAFMANAHHENTPDLLQTAMPQEVPAIVIADSANLNAEMGDSIDALNAAISDLAHEEARQTGQSLSGASVIAPANDSAAAPIIRDERPTFQDLTDARLDDINAILEDARSNDNRPGAPVATILTAAAAQTLHRISELDGIEAGTPEHEHAVEVTRDDISSLIANVADAREVHVTESEFAGIVAQDETALAGMLALSSPSAEGSAQEASADDARHLADFEALSGEMTDAKWSRAEAQALAQMEEMSDYKAEATEKNASRARNSTERDGGMDR